PRSRHDSNTTAPPRQSQIPYVPALYTFVTLSMLSSGVSGVAVVIAICENRWPWGPLYSLASHGLPSSAPSWMHVPEPENRISAPPLTSTSPCSPIRMSPLRVLVTVALSAYTPRGMKIGRPIGAVLSMAWHAFVLTPATPGEPPASVPSPTTPYFEMLSYAPVTIAVRRLRSASNVTFASYGAHFRVGSDGGVAVPDESIFAAGSAVLSFTKSLISLPPLGASCRAAGRARARRRCRSA